MLKIAIMVLGCLPAWAWAAAGAEVPAPVTAVIAEQRLPPSAVSFAIVDPDSGRLLFGQNPDTPRSPASTIKVVTTFAGLDLLGPAYTWHTRASIRGALRGGVLDGDLILQGGGDPYMTLERWWSFAGALRAKGLKTIHGDIVIDNTAFSLPAEDPAEFDGRPNRPYNVLPDALMVNFQSIEFRVQPDVDARRVDVIAKPAPVKPHKAAARPEKKPEAHQTARYAEFNSSGPGANPSGRPDWTRQLTKSEASKITIETVLGGEDRWNPESALRAPFGANRRDGESAVRTVRA